MRFPGAILTLLLVLLCGTGLARQAPGSAVISRVHPDDAASGGRFTAETIHINLLTFLPPGKGGGFAIDGSELVLPSNPTNYVVWHEFSHFRQFQHLGKDAYMALPRSKAFLAPEQFVFDMLENSPKRWNALNFGEQQHAIRYIEAVGGFR